MSKVNVKFNRNVKLGSELYAENSKLSVSKSEYEDLFKAGVIHEVDNLPEEVESAPEEVGYATFTREELDKVKKDDIKAFLDTKGIEYTAKDIKEELINLVLGE